MFRGSVKSAGYPLHSPSFPLPCVTVCHYISTVLYLRTPRGCMGKWINLETRRTCVEVSRAGRRSPVQSGTCTLLREVYMHPRVRLDASGDSSISSSCRKFNFVYSVALPWPNYYTECAIRELGCYIKRNKERIFFRNWKERCISSEANCLSAIIQIFPFLTTIEATVPIAQVIHRTTGEQVFWARTISSEPSHIISLRFVSAFSSIYTHVSHVISFLQFLRQESIMQARMTFLRKAEGSEIVNALLWPSRHRKKQRFLVM